METWVEFLPARRLWQWHWRCDCGKVGAWKASKAQARSGATQHRHWHERQPNGSQGATQAGAQNQTTTV